MLIQIHPIQIPKFWEAIKFSAVKSDAIQEEHLNYYCINLLQDLLSGKKACLVEQDENLNVVFVVLFSINIEPLTGVKYFFVANIYSFQNHGLDAWKELFNDAHKIARQAGCAAFAVNTSNPRAIEVAGFLGFELFTSKYYKML